VVYGSVIPLIRRTIVRAHKRRTRKGLTDVVRHQRNIKKPKAYLLSEDGIRNMAKEVTLVRLEGRIHEVDKPITVKSIREADHILYQWSSTAPERGYDKVEFEIIFKDGYKHTGRYDISKTGPDPDLARHVAQIYRYLKNNPTY